MNRQSQLTLDINVSLEFMLMALPLISLKKWRTYYLKLFGLKSIFSVIKCMQCLYYNVCNINRSLLCRPISVPLMYSPSPGHNTPRTMDLGDDHDV